MIEGNGGCGMWLRSLSAYGEERGGGFADFGFFLKKKEKEGRKIKEEECFVREREERTTHSLTPENNR